MLPYRTLDANGNHLDQFIPGSTLDDIYNLYNFDRKLRLLVFDAILAVIEKMGETGAYERYFRPEGGNIKAVPTYISIPRIDKRIGKIRLYCLRLSEQMLILGGGAATTSQKYEEDPVLLTIIGNLRDIEDHIKRLVRQANTDYDDFHALKRIIETITL